MGCSAVPALDVDQRPQELPGLGMEHFRSTENTLEPGLAEPLRHLARVAAGMVDMLELDLHRGEHLNFVV